MLVCQVPIVDLLIDELVLVSDLLSFLFFPDCNDSLVSIHLHLADQVQLLVLNELTLGIYDSHLVVDTSELVSQDAVDLLPVLRVQVIPISYQLTLKGNTSPILLDDIPGTRMPRHLISFTLLDLLLLKDESSLLSLEFVLLFLLLFKHALHPEDFTLAIELLLHLFGLLIQELSLLFLLFFFLHLHFAFLHGTSLSAPLVDLVLALKFGSHFSELLLGHEVCTTCSNDGFRDDTNGRSRYGLALCECFLFRL